MNKQQLDKINGLLNQIAEIEKILAIKSGKIRIAEYIDVQYRHIDSISTYKGHEVIVNREFLEAALTNYCNYLKAELKDLGYEE